MRAMYFAAMDQGLDFLMAVLAVALLISLIIKWTMEGKLFN